MAETPRRSGGLTFANLIKRISLLIQGNTHAGALKKLSDKLLNKYGTDNVKADLRRLKNITNLFFSHCTDGRAAPPCHCNTTKDGGCLLIVYRAFLHARGPDLLLRCLQASLLKPSEKDVVLDWALLVCWRLDFLISTGLLAQCTGQLMMREKDKIDAAERRTWWDADGGMLFNSVAMLSKSASFSTAFVGALMRLCLGHLLAPKDAKGNPKANGDLVLNLQLFHSPEPVPILLLTILSCEVQLAKQILEHLNLMLLKKGTNCRMLLGVQGWQDGMLPWVYIDTLRETQYKRGAMHLKGSDRDQVTAIDKGLRTLAYNMMICLFHYSFRYMQTPSVLQPRFSRHKRATTSVDFDVDGVVAAADAHVGILLSESFTMLEDAFGWSPETINVARTLLLSLVHKVAASDMDRMRNNWEEISWSSLFDVISVVENFVYFSPQKADMDSGPTSNSQSCNNNTSKLQRLGLHRIPAEHYPRSAQARHFMNLGFHIVTGRKCTDIPLIEKLIEVFRGVNASCLVDALPQEKNDKSSGIAKLQKRAQQEELFLDVTLRYFQSLGTETDTAPRTSDPKKWESIQQTVAELLEERGRESTFLNQFMGRINKGKNTQRLGQKLANAELAASQSVSRVKADRTTFDAEAKLKRAKHDFSDAKMAKQYYQERRKKNQAKEARERQLASEALLLEQEREVAEEARRLEQEEERADAVRKEEALRAEAAEFAAKQRADLEALAALEEEKRQRTAREATAKAERLAKRERKQKEREAREREMRERMEREEEERNRAEAEALRQAAEKLDEDVRCKECDTVLTTDFFEQDGEVFCEADYKRLFCSCFECHEYLGGENQYVTIPGETDPRLIHIRCLKCFECNKLLAKGSAQKEDKDGALAGVFQHEGHIYCQDDYNRLYGKLCAHCRQFIKGHDSLNVLDQHWHMHHFLCRGGCGQDLSSEPFRVPNAAEMAYYQLQHLGDRSKRSAHLLNSIKLDPQKGVSQGPGSRSVSPPSPQKKAPATPKRRAPPRPSSAPPKRTVPLVARPASPRATRRRPFSPIDLDDKLPKPYCDDCFKVRYLKICCACGEEVMEWERGLRVGEEGVPFHHRCYFCCLCPSPVMVSGGADDDDDEDGVILSGPMLATFQSATGETDEETNSKLTATLLVGEDDHLYCKSHLIKKFAGHKKCTICEKSLTGPDGKALPGTSAVSVGKFEFHIECVRCTTCHVLLKEEGQETFIHQPHPSKPAAFYCRRHYAAATQKPCTGCKGKLEPGQPVMGISGLKFHQSCITCNTCHAPLSADGKTAEKLYFANSDTANEEEQVGLYCGKDYERLFGHKCPQCLEPAAGQCIKIALRKYHTATCFSCLTCKAPLKPGEFAAHPASRKLFCLTCIKLV